MELPLFFILLVAAFGTVGCFNIHQLQSAFLPAHLHLNRVRRDYNFLDKCCKYKDRVIEGGPKIVDQCKEELSKKHGLVEPPMEEEKDGKEPEESIFSEAEMSFWKNRSVCFVQCIFEKQKQVKEDGSLIVEEAMKQTKAAISELTDSAAWEDIKKHCTKPNPVHTENYVCKRDAIDFMECVYFIAEAHCPESQVRISATCDGFREEVKSRYGI